MTALSRVIALLGMPVVTEDGNATEVITPGYMVEGVTSIQKNTVTGAGVPVRVALERSELGRGIDDSVSGSSSPAGSADYAVGETVKVGHFQAGDRFFGFVASGFNEAAGAFVEAATAGVVAAGTTNPIGFITEAVNATDPGDVRVTVEVS